MSNLKRYLENSRFNEFDKDVWFVKSQDSSDINSNQIEFPNLFNGQKAWPNKKEDDVYIWKKRLTENWPDKFRQVLLNMQNGVCWPLLLCWKLFVRHDIQRIKVVIDPPLNVVCLF